MILNAHVVGGWNTDTRTYVGRPTKWGNPFKVGPDGTRDEVIEKYRLWIATQRHLLADLHELRGKDLVCWCAPQRCHAQVLEDLANSLPQQDGNTHE